MASELPAPIATSDRRSRGGSSLRLFGFAVELLLTFVLTTILLMMYSTRLEHEELLQDVVRRARIETIDAMRREKLAKLQRTIFVNLNRPPDHTYNLNATLSEMTPLERKVQDTRDDRCQRDYDIDSLPTITVVIPFYNDALSMILRTVHSVLLKTPDKLLSQIIVVDDFSTNVDLREPLERYFKLLPRKVILVRTKKREGLMRARMIGASMATGEVLMFQDAHTEANVGWAEPLLAEIVKNPKTVIQPNVDQIEANTIEYLGSKGIGAVPRGGFTWDLRYVWMAMPEYEMKRINYQHDYMPQRTPTLVGCALAIRKDYFFSIGGFDDDMHVWGAENIELAFRAWMCGGQVLNHPCSRVAHVFKPFAYQFGGDGREKIVQRNQMRLAELWMDDWKKFFLASTYSWPTKHTYLTDAEKRSLEKRKILKRNLKCKGFKWYLDNVIPEVPTPPMDAVYYGEVFNLRSELCLYLASDGYVALTNFCYFHRLVPQNIFYIDTQGRLKYRSRCVIIDRSTWLMKVEDCPPGSPPAEIWDTIRHSEVEGMITVRLKKTPGSDEEMTLCPTQITNILPVHRNQQMPQVLPCRQDYLFQKWRWTYLFNFNYNWEKPSDDNNRKVSVR